MIEAMRGEVFCGKREVRIEDGEILLSNPDQDFAAAPEIALARIIASWRDHAVIFVGSGAVRYQEMMAREATRSAA